MRDGPHELPQFTDNECIHVIPLFIQTFYCVPSVSNGSAINLVTLPQSDGTWFSHAQYPLFTENTSIGYLGLSSTRLRIGSNDSQCKHVHAVVQTHPATPIQEVSGCGRNPVTSEARSLYCINCLNGVSSETFYIHTHRH